MNVAAYCRVSTDSDDQMNSLENQTSFFNEYIERNPDWNLVGIYSDEGVTGTSVAKRIRFNSMIQDAKDGKIDLIVTKEVSRFARNTVDTLSYTRELRKHGVGVYFINDNINTLESDGEFRLSIMASVAQEESRKTSARVKWGMRRQMEKGFVFSPPMLGYDSHNGVLTINDEEAKIVQRIFDLYVNHSMGSTVIAETLAKENTPLSKRIKCWSPTTVMRILKNEKYVGDLIQQKTVVTDYLTHRSVENKGEKLMFRDHHEPIVDRATWDEAQRICSMRKKNTVEFNAAKHSGKYWCSGKIQCGTCHGTCVTKTKKAMYDSIRIYRCKHTAYYQNENGGCTNSAYIDERILCACMQYVMRKISLSEKEINDQLLEALSNSKGQNEIIRRIESFEKKLTDLENRKKKTLSLLIDEVIAAEDYQLAIKDIDVQIFDLKNNINNLRKEVNTCRESETQKSTMLSQVHKYIEQSEITRKIYSEILDNIVMYEDSHIDISLIGSSEPFSVKYSRKGRGTQYKVYCEELSNSVNGEKQHVNTSASCVSDQ